MAGTLTYLRPSGVDPPGDKVPHPLVKHLSSVELVSRYAAEDGKQAGWTSAFNSNGLSNLRITKSLSNVPEL
jgi:hypothetical protein